jgi:hypothetical protein
MLPKLTVYRQRLTKPIIKPIRTPVKRFFAFCGFFVGFRKNLRLALSYDTITKSDANNKNGGGIYEAA